jgi:hypothetical protein
VVLFGGCRFLKQVEVTGEVRRTVNRVHGAWGGGSPRKLSAAMFPHDFGTAGGAPVLAMDEMQGGGQVQYVARHTVGGKGGGPSDKGSARPWWARAACGWRRLTWDRGLNG